MDKRTLLVSLSSLEDGLTTMSCISNLSLVSSAANSLTLTQLASAIFYYDAVVLSPSFSSCFYLSRIIFYVRKHLNGS